MMKRLHFLEKAQWFKPEALHSQRDALLGRLMQVAYQEVAFYRELMDSRGVRWQDIRCPSDLGRLPIATKALLRAQYPHKTTRYTGLKTYEVSSSGSTGTNFYVREDAATAGSYRASLLLSLEWAGWQIGEPHAQTGMTLSRSLDRKLKDLLLRCHYFSAFDLSDSNLDRILEVLEKRSILHLWGYPGSIYFLARRAQERGWNTPLRSVVTWGDNLYAHYRKTIEQVFKTRVFDTYGCGEGMWVAAQCGHGTHYHIHALDVIVEILDEDDNPVSPGKSGKVVLTRLHPGPMPLIRYAVGDVAVKAEERLCPCGRGFDILEAIQGRETDVVVTPSGNRLIVHFFTGVLEHFHEVECFQVVQQQLDSIILRIVPSRFTDFTDDSAKRIVSSLREKGLTDMQIVLDTVSDIPPSPSGKRRFVISEISHISGGAGQFSPTHQG